MWTILFVFIIIAGCGNTYAANNDDFNRIIINPYLSTELDIPKEAKDYLLTKLNHIVVENGVGGYQINPRFIITVEISQNTKDIISGPPQMIARNIELDLFIGDAISQTLYASAKVTLKGVGQTDTKSLIDAFKNLKTKSKDIVSFIETGKKKIVEYYSFECEFILKKASTQASINNYEQALYELMTVPSTCKECFDKCNDLAKLIHSKQLQYECSDKLNKAQTIWSNEPTQSGARKVSDILITIVPVGKCESELNTLRNNISTSLTNDQNRQYAIEYQKQVRLIEHDRNMYELRKMYIAEYLRNQPKTIVFTRIYWR